MSDVYQTIPPDTQTTVIRKRINEIEHNLLLLRMQSAEYWSMLATELEDSVKTDIETALQNVNKDISLLIVRIEALNNMIEEVRSEQPSG